MTTVAAPLTTRHASVVRLDAAANVPAQPVRVMLLVSSLEHGGAERQVIELYRALDRKRFAPIICTLSDYVPLLEQSPDLMRDLVIVRKRWKYDLSAVFRVGQVTRERGISLIHAFLFDAEVVARTARRLGLVPAVISSERNSDYALGRVKSACFRLTRTWFDAMIANSAAGKRLNVESFGVASDRIHVIRNGVDIHRFRPIDGLAIRTKLGIPVDAPLVGMIASFKRQKRYEDFFRAARLVLDTHPAARFMCVGEPLHDNREGADGYHQEMRELVASLELGNRIVFAGSQADMPAVYSACDVTALTSSREGTPNVLLESMACGVPVVATDVADNSLIVQDGLTGFIVPKGDVQSVADRLRQLLSGRDERRRMGAAGRAWVASEFSTETLARRTEAIYAQALGRAGEDQIGGAGR
jgi:glycosyltransferase involved in cell wall biosynthesis